MDHSKQRKRLTLDSNASSHFVSEEERRCFVNYVNDVLKDQAEGIEPPLPLNPNSETEICQAVRNGVLLPKLLQVFFPGLIDRSSLAGKSVAETAGTFVAMQNHQMFLDAAKNIGCHFPNIGVPDLLDSQYHIVMAVIYQLLKTAFTEKILVCVQGKTFEKRNSSEALLAWIIEELGQNSESYNKLKPPLRNYTNDLQDSTIFLLLLERISPHALENNILDNPDPTIKAEAVISIAKSLGCNFFISTKTILGGFSKTNFLFLAHLMNNLPELILKNQHLINPKDIMVGSAEVFIPDVDSASKYMRRLYAMNFELIQEITKLRELSQNPFSNEVQEIIAKLIDERDRYANQVTLLKRKLNEEKITHEQEMKGLKLEITRLNDLVSKQEKTIQSDFKK